MPYCIKFGSTVLYHMCGIYTKNYYNLKLMLFFGVWYILVDWSSLIPHKKIGLINLSDFCGSASKTSYWGNQRGSDKIKSNANKDILWQSSKIFASFNLWNKRGKGVKLLFLQLTNGWGSKENLVRFDMTLGSQKLTKL